MKVISVVGARPQFVKASVTSSALAAEGVEELILHTGQHYDREMSQVFFDELAVPAPLLNLGIGSGSHARQTARMLEALEPVLEAQGPDMVLVYGDTNSTLAAALVAAKLRLPIAHVEAGVRSGDRNAPEEINRIVTDRVSTLLFAPTTTAAENLQREGEDSAAIRLVGDVMYDAALRFGAIADRNSEAVQRLGLARGEYVLSTVHRAENTEVPVRLRSIVDALVRLTADMPVVLPLHPRTRRALRAMSLSTGEIQIVEPLSYFDMLALERSASVIVTDSGGLQKEAFFCRVPCVTLLDATGWIELVELGWNRLAPPGDADRIVDSVLAMIGVQGEDSAPYGDGRAAQRIAQGLVGCASSS